MRIDIDMIPIKFNAKKWKQGSSWVITIPSGISGLIEQDREYVYSIDEKEDE